MKIVLGVTGSIAAYKAAALARLLAKRSHEVRVAMTPAAARFVSPLTFRTLVRNPVAMDMFGEPAGWKPEHVALAEWADLVLVAPASANTLAKMRCGVADNLLLSAVLAADPRKVAAAPAMNSAMWSNPATRENIEVLSSRGVRFASPGSGELACGVSGDGRMAEPEQIAEALGL